MKNGFLLIDKESGYTSRDVCNIIGKKLHANKVGHCGTLDPFATGLLLVAVGSATKTLVFLDDNYKTYEGELKLGQKTDTGDLTGEIIETLPIPEIDLPTLQKVLASLVGENEQTVPITSAVHVNGKKLYEYAHAGMEVDLPSRAIEIKSLELISYKNPIIKFKANVSKGTYIRVLGETIAEQLGTVGHLVSLCRTEITDANLSQAKKVNDITEEDIIDLGDVLEKYMPILKLTHPDQIKKAKHGGKLSLRSFPKIYPLFCVCDDKNFYLAIYKYSDLGYYECIRGLDFENR